MKNNPVQRFVTSYITTSKVLLFSSILGIGSLSANPAKATSLVNNTGIPNPATTITFSEIPLANGTVLTDRYASLGVTFSGLFYNPFPSVFPSIDPPGAGNFSDGNFSNATNPFIISFSQSQSAAAFSLVTLVPGTSTFEALLNGTVVDSFTNATNFSSFTNFYGFTGVTFDSVRVNTTNTSGMGIIDNIQFNSLTAQSVPEPFSIIGTLVGGTAAFRIRKKLKKGV